MGLVWCVVRVDLFTSGGIQLQVVCCVAVANTMRAFVALTASKVGVSGWTYRTTTTCSCSKISVSPVGSLCAVRSVGVHGSLMIGTMLLYSIA